MISSAPALAVLSDFDTAATKTAGTDRISRNQSSNHPA